jgi:hypothetical protein
VPLSRNLGTLTSWNPLELLYFYPYVVDNLMVIGMSVDNIKKLRHLRFESVVVESAKSKWFIFSTYTHLDFRHAM